MAQLVPPPKALVLRTKDRVLLAQAGVLLAKVAAEVLLQERLRLGLARKSSSV